MSDASGSPTGRPTLVIVRRQSGGIGGAEKAARRMSAMFAQDWDISLLCAGTEPGHLPGTRGPSWWRAWRFAFAASTWLSQHRPTLVLSLERGVECDVYRAGDGVHRRWLELSGRRIKQVFNPLHWVSPRLERISALKSRCIVANSAMVAGEFLKAYPEAAHKIRVIHNGVDRTQYYPPTEPIANIRRRLGLETDDGVSLIFAGSGWMRKGLSHALAILHQLRAQASPRLAGARLVVIGKGRPDQYAKEIHNLGLGNAVVFAGSVANPLPYYQQADAMILPTLYDPFANTCIEALACGCPVITTDTNGASEALQPGVNGLVIPGQLTAADVPAESNRVAVFLMENRLPKADISATVERFTIAQETSAYRALFHELTSTNRP